MGYLIHFPPEDATHKGSNTGILLSYRLFLILKFVMLVGHLSLLPLIMHVMALYECVCVRVFVYVRVFQRGRVRRITEDLPAWLCST